MRIVRKASSAFKNELSILDAIYLRRAVRKYSRRKVSRRYVEELLHAAVQAPSAMNKQPWSFLILQRPQLLERISDEAKHYLLHSPEARDSCEQARKPLNQEDFDVFYGASTLIVICSDSANNDVKCECYLAAENLMLAAVALGLGTCPLGFLREILAKEPLRRELILPSGCLPVLPIAVGYPMRTVPQPPRRPPFVYNWMK